MAAGRGFSVIIVRPGTGKTTTVVRLLALLQGLRHDKNEKPLRIRIAAPTGKAAARLNASVGSAVHRLPPPDEALRANIPTEVTTIHRLLGELSQRAYTPATADWLEAVSGEPISTALRDTDGGALKLNLWRKGKRRLPPRESRPLAVESHKVVLR